MSRRILIIGSSGLLGRALLRHVPADVVPLAPSQDDLPMEDRAGLSRFYREEAVDGLILAAAWTQVDACEEDPDRAYLVNGILPGRAARMADRLGLPVTFISTDYVFGGQAGRPYREFDPVDPQGVYARSKWHGECAVREVASDHRIVRTSGLFGAGGPDFVQAILARLEQGGANVVTDEVNSPTWVDHLAPALWQIALSEESGTFHAAAGGAVSRFEMACRIALWSGCDPALVRPTTRAAFGRPAPRPGYSALNCQALREIHGLSLPSWEEGLHGFLRAIGRAR